VGTSVAIDVAAWAGDEVFNTSYLLKLLACNLRAINPSAKCADQQHKCTTERTCALCGREYQTAYNSAVSQWNVDNNTTGATPSLSQLAADSTALNAGLTAAGGSTYASGLTFNQIQSAYYQATDPNAYAVYNNAIKIGQTPLQAQGEAISVGRQDAFVQGIITPVVNQANSNLPPSQQINASDLTVNLSSANNLNAQVNVKFTPPAGSSFTDTQASSINLAVASNNQSVGLLLS